MSETIDAPAPEAAAADESDTLRDVLSRAFDETPEDSGPPRDEQGRFASRQAAEGADAETTSTENVETKAEEPEVPAIVPPQSLSAAEKEAFGNLPREAQEIILRREQETASRLEQTATEARALEPIKGVLDRYRPLYAARGLPPEQAISALFEAQALLEQNPVQGLAAIARGYGIDLGALAQNPGAAQAQPQPAPQHVDVDARIAAALADERTKATISAFAADPKNEHFATVRATMGALAQVHPDKGLPELYEMACKAHPDVSAKLAAAEKAKTEAAALAERKKAAEAARRASGSVRGAPPTNGFIPPPDSLRGTLEAAFEGRLN